MDLRQQPLKREVSDIDGGGEMEVGQRDIEIEGGEGGGGK
jgi:hypothetical protein